MTSALRIVLLQYKVQWHAIKVNSARIEQLLQDIELPVDLILLPEMFATGFTMQPEDISEQDTQWLIEWMKKIAYDRNATIMGSHPVREANAYYNRLLCISPAGEIKYYDKRHLFAMSEEDMHYMPGNEKLIVEIKGWKIMPLICYDLRFPVWSRNTLEYDVLIYHANWPASRNLAWQTLLSARAIENQSYSIGVNCVGIDKQGIEYIGNSSVFSPKGELLNSISTPIEAALLTELDLFSLQQFRTEFPVLKDADRFILQ